MPLPMLPPLKILLVGNYTADRQESMQRFASVLESTFIGMGQSCILIKPISIIGKCHFSIKGLNKWLGYIDKFIFFPFILKREAKAGAFDIIHICDHSNAPYIKSLRTYSTCITCHDLLAIRSAEGHFTQNPVKKTGRIFQKWIKNGLKNAPSIAFVSNKTEVDFIETIGTPISQSRVIYNGLNYNYRPLALAECKPSLNLHAPFLDTCDYILHVGNNNWYKNREGLLTLFATIKKKSPTPLKLVLVGQPLTPTLKSLAKKLNITPDIIETGPLSNHDLNAFYSQARCLIFPSIEEGFCWPILEAMAAGCPVITTKKQPMEEIGGKSATYIDPYPNDVSLIQEWCDHSSDILFNLLNESIESKSHLIQKGFSHAQHFSTEHMARCYLEFYHETLKHS